MVPLNDINLRLRYQKLKSLAKLRLSIKGELPLSCQNGI